MTLQRSLSVDNLPELRSSDWLGIDIPRLMLYNDGTGCVLQLRRPGSTSECYEEDHSTVQELPVACARLAQRMADFVEELSGPCCRHFVPTLVGSFVFGGVVLASRWLMSHHVFLGNTGSPIMFGL